MSFSHRYDVYVRDVFRYGIPGIFDHLVENLSKPIFSDNVYKAVQTFALLNMLNLTHKS